MQTSHTDIVIKLTVNFFIDILKEYYSKQVILFIDSTYLLAFHYRLELILLKCRCKLLLMYVIMAFWFGDLPRINQRLKWCSYNKYC